MLCDIAHKCLGADPSHCNPTLIWQQHFFNKVSLALACLGLLVVWRKHSVITNMQYIYNSTCTPTWQRAGKIKCQVGTSFD
jgi:hypothetical protein